MAEPARHAQEPRTSPGRFITLEGGEGAGKSTQALLLSERLRALGRTVLVTREPGGSERAEALRSVILSGAASGYGPFAEAALFAAARADHVARTIRPALERGEIVICDRFVDSSSVYQGAVGGLSRAVLRRFEDAAIDGHRPHLTLILDLPVERGLARATARREQAGADRFEREGASYHERVRAAFQALAASEPDRCVLVDATGPADAVAARIWSHVQAVVARSEPADGG